MPPTVSTASPTARLLWAILTLSLVMLGVTAPPAQAATTLTTTGSCVDGGGMTWHTKVIWGDYLSVLDRQVEDFGRLRRDGRQRWAGCGPIRSSGPTTEPDGWCKR